VTLKDGSDEATATTTDIGGELARASNRYPRASNHSRVPRSPPSASLRSPALNGALRNRCRWAGSIDSDFDQYLVWSRNMGTTCRRSLSESARHRCSSRSRYRTLQGRAAWRHPIVRRENPHGDRAGSKELRSAQAATRS
jgi:hypothetical protein